MEHIAARKDEEDRNGTKSQRGVNMDQEDKELDWSIIVSRMRRLRNEMREIESVNLQQENWCMGEVYI